MSVSLCVFVCVCECECLCIHEGNSGDVDLCGCEAYAELNDFNYQTASIEQSQAFVSCDSNPHTYGAVLTVCVCCVFVHACVFC